MQQGKVVVNVHTRRVVRWRYRVVDVLAYVDAVEQILEQAHGGVRRSRWIVSAKCGPVRRLQVLDDVVAARFDELKQCLEAGLDMLVDVAAVVDDDVEWSNTPGEVTQIVSVTLVALDRADPWTDNIRLGVDVQSVDKAAGEE